MSGKLSQSSLIFVDKVNVRTVRLWPMAAILYYSLYYNPTHQYNLKYYTAEVKYNVILAFNNLIGTNTLAYFCCCCAIGKVNFWIIFAVGQLSFEEMLHSTKIYWPEKNLDRNKHSSLLGCCVIAKFFLNNIGSRTIVIRENVIALSWQQLICLNYQNNDWKPFLATIHNIILL